MKVAKIFIFYTTEGSTFQPDSVSDVPDVENCQILGWGKGGDAEEAFSDFKNENSQLRILKFNEIIGVELRDEKRYYFNLKN